MSDIFDLEEDNSVSDNISLLMPDLPWLKELNPEQRKAVETTSGAVLVSSGAGTGKTKVLTLRLAYILATHKANPWNCLVVTFTNRAAKEMTQRARNLIGDMVDSVWMGTFHGICAKILRQHAELVGLQKNFTILGEDDQRRLIKQIMEAQGIDDKKYPPQGLLDKIQLWKDKGWSVDKINLESNSILPSVYKLYQQRLLELNCVDFGDILLYTLNILTSYPEVLAKYQERFTYIMVDEYQDTNVTQYLLLRLLSQKHGNICCVGDEDQSIYSWRGAEIQNIMRFKDDFKNAEIIRLEQNYRSSSNILETASNLISHNQTRHGKHLRVAKNSPAITFQNDLVKVVSTYSGADEAMYIADEIRKSTVPYSEIAVLVRTAAQTRELEERFIKEAIAYQVIGGPKFYERAEIRDILAYLRVIMQPHDDLALERIINKPARGIGAKSVDKIRQMARQNGISMYMAIEKGLLEGSFSGKIKNSLAELIDLFKKWRQELPALRPDETAQDIIVNSGYQEMLENDKTPESQGRLENLQELVNVMSDYKQYPRVEDFLEHVSLVMENDNAVEKDKVMLITLHSAKGLEFDTVFLPGWEEGLFPHQRALDEGKEDALEEERRLAYVAITRARRKLYIIAAMNRRMYGQWKNNPPSRFINELPRKNIEIINKAAPYFGSSSVNLREDFEVVKDSERYSYVRDEELDQTGFYPRADKTFNKGTKVFHQTFGYGKIIHIEGNKLEIFFDKYGHKRLLKDYVTKES
ncbi:MAG: UvrD-helicase domain-containing protein [Alphaproteobacteria bacterium]|nr:UvrD-helicase domain-containing protein [Alphaproteobacteria bacterium]